jgi:hypothetical protein
LGFPLTKYGGERKLFGQQWEKMDFGRYSANSLINKTFTLNSFLFLKLEYVTEWSNFCRLYPLPKGKIRGQKAFRGSAREN